MRLWRRGGARFDGDYRYRLWRVFSDAPTCVTFVMLNPSRADAEHDDPTIRRCVGFAHDWGFGRLEVVNLFAYCATHPRELAQAPEPVGRHNDRAVRRAVRRADRVVVAWGIHGQLLGRHERAPALLRGVEPLCFGTTQSGAPRHPLYVRTDAPLHPWVPKMDSKSV